MNPAGQCSDRQASLVRRWRSIGGMSTPSRTAPLQPGTLTVPNLPVGAEPVRLA